MGLNILNCESLKEVLTKLDHIQRNSFQKTGAARLSSKPGSLFLPSLEISFVKSLKFSIYNSVIARASVPSVEVLPSFVPLPLDYYKVILLFLSFLFHFRAAQKNI